MLYVFSKCNEGTHVIYEEGGYKPQNAKEYRVNINGEDATAGISEDAVYIMTGKCIERKPLVTFVKWFIRRYSQYDWWKRNAARLDILESLNTVATV